MCLYLGHEDQKNPILSCNKFSNHEIFYLN